MNIQKFLRKLLGVKPEIVHISKRLTDKELISGLAVEPGHPTFLATLEMIERAIEEVRVEAKIGIDQRGTLTANLGAQWALEDLRNSLIQFRFTASSQMRRHESMAANDS